MLEGGAALCVLEGGAARKRVLEGGAARKRVLEEDTGRGCSKEEDAGRWCIRKWHKEIIQQGADRSLRNAVGGKTEPGKGLRQEMCVASMKGRDAA